MRKIITSITALLVLFGMFFTAYQFIDNKISDTKVLAQAVKTQVDQLQQTQDYMKKMQEKESKRLDYKILTDQYRDIQRTIIELQQSFRTKKMDDKSEQVLKDLQSQQDEIDKQRDALRKEAIK